MDIFCARMRHLKKIMLAWRHAAPNTQDTQLICGTPLKKVIISSNLLTYLWAFKIVLRAFQQKENPCAVFAFYLADPKFTRSLRRDASSRPCAACAQLFPPGLFHSCMIGALIKSEERDGARVFSPLFARPTSGTKALHPGRGSRSVAPGGRTQAPGNSSDFFNNFFFNIYIFFKKDSRRSTGGFTKVASVLTVTHLITWLRHKTTQGSVFYAQQALLLHRETVIRPVWGGKKRHLKWRPLPLCDLCAVINNKSMLVVVVFFCLFAD